MAQYQTSGGVVLKAEVQWDVNTRATRGSSLPSERAATAVALLERHVSGGPGVEYLHASKRKYCTSTGVNSISVICLVKLE